MTGIWKFTENVDNYVTVKDSPMQLERGITQSGETRLAGGYLRFVADGEFGPHPVAYDELFFVLSGSLELVTETEKIELKPGQAGLIAEGAVVTYRGTAGTLAGYAATPRH
jgi:ethanolamine utilization protein EutQ (cupin superfamily)